MPVAAHELADAAQGLNPDVLELRRDIHAHPELGLQLPQTQKRILDAITGMGLHVTKGTSTTSVVADLDTGKPGPTVLLRADMDALPLTEDTGESFQSTVQGAMHACGHDAHVAMLVGAAQLLSDNKAELTGRVRFMFQPGEEGHHGARYMIEEGVLEGVDRCFAIHITPNIPAGVLAARAGSIMASADRLEVNITGQGGHASTPHFAVDPIPAAASMVTSFQTMITRDIEAFDPAVLTVARITAGTTNNVIPETAQLEGTIRAVSEKTRAKVHESVHRVANGVAAAHNCTCAVTIEKGYPVTVNHAADVNRVEQQVQATLGDGRYVDMPSPVMGAEDFSYLLQLRPGAIAFLGACPADVENFFEAEGNHSNRMRVNEDSLASGVAMYASMALP